MHRVRRRSLVAVAAVTGMLALAAPAALAGPISANADCTAQAPLARVFNPWLDLANYSQSPDGGVENDAAGWTLSGDAAVVAGNETYAVGGAGDGQSLSVPAGSSVTSAPTCVGLEWPTIRFFARSSGTSLLSLLRVEVLFEDGLTGGTRALPAGVVLPNSSWQPTLPMLMVVNTFGALTRDGMIPVAFRFTPFLSGRWQIDDLYVDPWRGP
jgi:hypothetical protein